MGNNWNAFRNQAQEMAKDFAKDCPEVQITTNRADADYQVSLNHIEVGLFARDNQFAVTDMFGKLLSTKQRGSIRGGVKDACELVVADWSNQTASRQKLIDQINGSFQKSGVLGYAEVSGDRLTVHSERASEMRLRMLLASQRELSMLRRAGFVVYIYTNDADKTFMLDVKAGQIVPPTPRQTAETTK